MRRPVTVFAWLRHQRPTGYEVANRQQEVAQGSLRPPARGYCGNAESSASARGVRYLRMARMRESLDPVTSRTPSCSEGVCSVLGASAPKLAGGALVRA